ncbi:hypothetical protein ILYODFUR_011580 [Ilyodon furcidens]|uniref:Uncharacterized protein n=1 Tax=Ilyodon furcidens TaxID=33524 RepID=A0ABV0U7J9_9TELE
MPLGNDGLVLLLLSLWQQDNMGKENKLKYSLMFLLSASNHILTVKEEQLSGLQTSDMSVRTFLCKHRPVLSNSATVVEWLHFILNCKSDVNMQKCPEVTCRSI